MIEARGKPRRRARARLQWARTNERWRGIGFVADEDGAPSIEMVRRHIRAALLKPLCQQGRITLGLKEAMTARP